MRGSSRIGPICASPGAFTRAWSQPRGASACAWKRSACRSTITAWCARPAYWRPRTSSTRASCAPSTRRIQRRAPRLSNGRVAWPARVGRPRRCPCWSSWRAGNRLTPTSCARALLGPRPATPRAPRRGRTVLLEGVVTAAPGWAQPWVELARSLAAARRWDLLARVLERGGRYHPDQPQLQQQEIVLLDRLGADRGRRPAGRESGGSPPRLARGARAGRAAGAIAAGGNGSAAALKKGPSAAENWNGMVGFRPRHGSVPCRRRPREGRQMRPRGTLGPRSAFPSGRSSHLAPGNRAC